MASLRDRITFFLREGTSRTERHGLISYYTCDNSVNSIELTFNSWFKYSVIEVDNCSRNSLSIARQVESDSAEVTAFCVPGKAADPVMERFSKFGTEDR